MKEGEEERMVGKREKPDENHKKRKKSEKRGRSGREKWNKKEEISVN